MTSRERRWCLGLSAALLVLTSVPYFLGFQTQGESWTFTGFVFGVDDGNSYIAKMLRGEAGDWLFRSPYTSAPQHGVLAFLPYLLIGKLASGDQPHLQLVSLFHLFRAAAIPLDVLATYAFLSLFTADRTWRRWGTVMAMLGGGLGWLLVLIGRGDWLGSLPLDFYSPETFGFLAIYGLPHLVLARALLLWALCRYVDLDRRAGDGWRAGILLLGLALVQPLSVATAYAVIGAHIALVTARAWRSADRDLVRVWIRRAIQATLPSAPLVLYFVLSFSRDDYLSLWTEQNRILSPHPLHYLFAYGLIAVPAAAGGYRLLRQAEARRLLPVAWGLVFPFLAYAPHNLQRRLPEGTWVTLIALAAVALAAMRPGVWPRLAASLLLTGGFSSALLLLGGARVALAPSLPAFRPADEVAAFECLARNSADGDVVASSFTTGNALPAWAPVRVVVGHGPESAGLDELLPEIRALYSRTTSTQARAAFLQSQGVDFVIDGPAERELGSWDPGGSGELSLVCEQGAYGVYRVGPP